VASDSWQVDAVMVRITPPDDRGFCSLGPAADIVRSCMQASRLVVGEVHPALPRTSVDTLFPLSDFHLLVSGEGEVFSPATSGKSPATERISEHLAALVEDGTCLAVTTGPLFDALASRLDGKRDLGIHTPYFTDALAQLVETGVVTNRNKRYETDRSLAVYAAGSEHLMQWLDGRTEVVFSDLEKVFDPAHIGENPDMLFIYPAERVDLAGRPLRSLSSMRRVPAFDEVVDFALGAALSRNGRTVVAVPSRDAAGRCAVMPYLDEGSEWDLSLATVSAVVTERGTAPLAGRSLRERVQLLIDVAHPEDRSWLVEEARSRKLLYPDQKFIAECAVVYPEDIREQMRLPEGETVHFRVIRPSDEEGMRRLFYRFSERSVYYRYFSRIRAMPHEKMQEYVNVDCRSVVSVVGRIGTGASERIVAEARYVLDAVEPAADIAFLVDEEFQGKGIGSRLFQLLVRLASERGIQWFTADVLPENRSMFKVFERSGLNVDAHIAEGSYRVRIELPARGAE
jgi:RimJ/RimL family protein N-acetyltransferase